MFKICLKKSIDMNILITGARGFIGKNLVERLKCIRDGKDTTRDYASILPINLLEYSHSQDKSELMEYCKTADFVFNLAGVNRCNNPIDFQKGNVDFLNTLLDYLSESDNSCDIVQASSIQAKLDGRFAGSEYGKTKLQAEEILKAHQEKSGCNVYIFRLPNTFGKWQKPDYNSVVATFCNNIAADLPIAINDPDVSLELLYIDDLIDAFIDCLLGDVAVDSQGFCFNGTTHNTTVGEVASLITSFNNEIDRSQIAYEKPDSLEKKLHATYNSFLATNAKGKWHYDLTSHIDARGSFAELFKTPDRGQVSVNVSNPGVTKGQHWHNTKWEKFCVVYGKGIIRQRKVGLDINNEPYPVTEREVSGEKLEIVETIPGYTHSLTNTSDTDIMVTIIWSNECFDPKRPDTFSEDV